MTAARAGVLAIGLAGCGNRIDECPAEPIDLVRTVLSVDWETKDAGASWVEYGASGGDLDRSTAPVEDDDGQHHAAIFGFGPFEDVAYRAVTEIRGRRHTCEGEATTGGPPSTFPDVQVTAYEPDLAADFPWLLGAIQGSPHHLFLIDREGRLLWYRDAPEEYIWIQVEPVDGGLVHNEFHFNFQRDESALEFVDWEGRIVERLRTPQGHHVFAQRDDAWTYLRMVPGYWNDPDMQAIVEVAGDGISEVTADGTVTDLYSTWGSIDIEKGIDWDRAFYPGLYDWTHANSLTWNPDRGTFLVSLASLRRVVEVERATGAIVRSMGLGGSYDLPEEDVWYNGHDARYLDNGNLQIVTTMQDGTESGVVEYAIDDGAGTMSVVRRTGFELRVLAHVLGQGLPLDNGNLLVNFGGGGLLVEYTPSGEIAWSVDIEASSFFAQVRPIDTWEPLQ